MPAKLRDVVLAIVHDRPVVPVARIDTSRTIDVLYGSDGTALAEFSDDHVSAWADGRTPNNGGGSGGWSWPRMRSPGVAPMSSCWRG